MQCWQCGKTLREGAKLCVYCGALLSSDADDFARSPGTFDPPPEEAPPEPPRPRKTSSASQRNRFPPQLPGQRPRPRNDGASDARSASTSQSPDPPAQPAFGSPSRSPDRADANDRGRESRDAGWGEPSLPRIVYEPAAGASRRSGDGARLPDPLDDPRAPQVLRSTPDQVPGRYD